jgi:hypothetical protein
MIESNFHSGHCGVVRDRDALSAKPASLSQRHQREGWTIPIGSHMRVPLQDLTRRFMHDIYLNSDDTSTW